MRMLDHCNQLQCVSYHRAGNMDIRDRHSYRISPVQILGNKVLFTCNVLLVGDAGTGKTSIAKRVCNGTFNWNYNTTTRIDLYESNVSITDTLVILNLIDVPGELETASSLRCIPWNYVYAACVVYDVTRPHTMHQVKEWTEKLRTFVQPRTGHPIPFVLLANKRDYDTVVSAEKEREIYDYCRKNDFRGWFYTSTKDSINMYESFEFLVTEVIRIFERSEEIPDVLRRFI